MVGGGQGEHVDVRVLAGGVGGGLVPAGDADGRRHAVSGADAREKADGELRELGKDAERGDGIPSERK
jgi:hypothetical protein